MYKATDTRLDRTVAIKVLPEHVANDPDLKQRFEREARTVAALNHPHICTLYDIGKEGETDFLVMEYLDGQTLAQRLEKGALPLDQALTIAIEIADALDKAHRQGIVHRDLKPANIMLTKAGAKLLDFGLAKLKPADQVGGLSAMATQSAGLTGEGTILGTLQYMAPEQLEGKEADHRTDIFAFGAVLYEIVTGAKAFEGESQANLMAAILEREAPPMSQRHAVSPPTLDWIVATCLAKQPDSRWQSAGDVGRHLVRLTQDDTTEASAAFTGSTPTTAWTQALPWGLVAALVLFGAGSVLRERMGRPNTAAVARLQIGVQPAERIADRPNGRVSRTGVVLTSDGRTVIFTGHQDGTIQLFRRDLAEPMATPMAGTEEAQGPFLSPDGEWVGFWASGALKKAPMAGGPPVTIGETGRLFGASWGADDRIVFATENGGLMRVSANGGTPEPLTQLDPDLNHLGHRLPWLLPGGEQVLFTVRDQQSPREGLHVVVQSLTTGERKIVVENAADARYVPTGHLAFVRLGVLMAAPFNLETRQITGGVVALEDGVAQAINSGNTEYDTAAAQFAFSDSGSMAFLGGGIDPDRLKALIWIDRRGDTEVLPFELRDYLAPRLSPDGRRIAVHDNGADRAIWVGDVVRGAMTRLRIDGTGAFAFWTPDGRWLTYGASRYGPRNLYRQLVDGSGDAERLTTSSDQNDHGGSWFPDGAEVVFVHGHDDIWMLSMEGDRTPRPVVQTEFAEMHPALSPDGRWLAYTSDESGRNEVYVQPYPGSGARQQISTAGGDQPAWSDDGRELYYVTLLPASPTAGRAMMVVDVTEAPVLVIGIPTKLFDWSQSPSTPIRRYDVAPDGRFLVATSDESLFPEHLRAVIEPPPAQTHLFYVQNWFEELKARLPVN